MFALLGATPMRITRYALLLLLVGAAGPSRGGDIIEEHQVLAAAKQRFQFQLEINGDVDPATFCAAAHRIAMPDVCGAQTSRAPVYLVEVVPGSAPVRASFAISPAGDAYCIDDESGFQRWLDDYGASCSSAKDLLGVVRAYVRVVYAPEFSDWPTQYDWKPLAVCDSEPEADPPTECRPPNVTPTPGGLSVVLALKISQKPPGSLHICHESLRPGTAPGTWIGETSCRSTPTSESGTWTTWRFAMSRKGRFESELFSVQTGVYKMPGP